MTSRGHLYTRLAILEALRSKAVGVFGPVLLRYSACARVVSPAVAVADALGMRGV